MRYSLVAVDFLPPPAVSATLSHIAADLAANRLHPLPHVVHDLGAVRAALRQMSQARHVGKIVVRARTLQQNQGPDKVRLRAVAGLATCGWMNMHGLLKALPLKCFRSAHPHCLASSVSPLPSLPPCRVLWSSLEASA